MTSVRRAVLFEFFLLDDHRAVIFVARGDLAEPALVQVEADIGALGLAASESEPPWPDHEEFAAWNAAAAALVAPVAEWTDPGDVVWFVPHRTLHSIPLHALEVGGRPLIERNPVCYSPSASTMRYCRERNRGMPARVLILADSDNERPLAHARVQAEGVASVFPAGGAELALGKAVTRERLVDVSGFDALHVACHGFFDPADARLSGLQLAGADRVTADQWPALRPTFDMVTLSACSSGRARRLPGDELLGLSRAVLAGGAASLVVSLWNVDQVSTSILMTRFYRSLRDGDARAEALQKAQLAVRDLTVAELVDYCADARRTTAEPDRLGRDLAHALMQARDFGAALAEYERLAATVDDEELAIAMARCRRALRAPSPIDYSVRPFASPYYWAPFVLMGDWR